MSDKKDRPGKPRHDTRKGPRPPYRDDKRSEQRSDQRGPRPPRPERTERPEKTASLRPLSSDSIFLYGRHAVEAAAANPEREALRLIAAPRAAETAGIVKDRWPRLPVINAEDDSVFAGLVPTDSPHQGIVLEVRPLPGHSVDELTPEDGRPNIILMLDQVTDPHNVGACLRSAAALGARALITQDRHSPHESGVLARSASGALESLPWMRVGNLSHTLDELKEMGYWHVGLDGDTETELADVNLGRNIVIVMGSEGKGLRPLVAKHCDMIARIPMSGLVESLNVSNAAAIALYELGMRGRKD
ncbi:23S rRNA (guanosine(2251)-2'-O)-methyltransferase RlmB [Pseudokordiimonas caeni]|uniref:23S rRNA (guanosine(2251)-2'-O)-methyltransferase RlmB n=1 Tax=Pseudokordiimonas caeni TaxID=2997908 RepID=UPI0028110FB8|nr:23S rRNA (guanosine(2251)-2'-O)-methyltransferase RlmB [Pseudokordiimonas caeni]